jgi:hypothetical protein
LVTNLYLAELYPFATRARGIALFQLFGRGANFFNTFVNPIGMKNAQWKYLLSYVVFLVFEITIIYFLWPETSGRTLEELAFLFEDKDKAEQAAAATDKQLQHDEDVGENYRTGVSEKDGPAVVQSEGAPVAEKDGTGVTTIENKTT